MSGTEAPRVLVSVSDKTDLGGFVQELVDLGFEIVSTGGTAEHLRQCGVPVVDVSDYTGFPEIMQGRVKTLHPRVHGGILGRPDVAGDAEAMSELGITPFTLVVCNLYPFEQTVARPDVTTGEAIENIDIGGPGMIRAAAKNFACVGVVTRPDQYPQVIEELKSGELSLEFRRTLAAAAFELTARYDRAVADWFASTSQPESAEEDRRFPQSATLRFHRSALVRYGENPHQAAAVYVESRPAPSTLAAAEQLHGKELSYNNLLDLDAALALVREFEEPAAVAIKHTNPCGCAVGESLHEAFDRAYAGDPISAFGAILGFNRKVDRPTAERLCEPTLFIEAIIAPAYDADALEVLITRPKWRNNVRLMKLPELTQPREESLEYRSLSGGLLMQERDDQEDSREDWEVMTKRIPSDAERRDLEFAWKVCKHVKSNAIVLAKAGMVVGVGAGQMSRLDSSLLAGIKAGERAEGSVVASDAFFPFRDGVDEAAKAGATAVIQPGGSRGDEEVIAACDEHEMAMIFTGRRHFRH